MKLKKSERKLLEKRKAKIEEVIFACQTVDGFDYDGTGMTEFGAKFLNPSARYLSKVVDSLIERRLDFVNKDGSEIGPVVTEETVNAGSYTPVDSTVLETVSNDGVTCSEKKSALVSEGNLVVG